ncbi:LEA type 2 family protein [Thermococcus stetteri]|uniref:LEA type 2 family protein n=1 Tax=Thermococcus stetteri TaxID=49900 RepID=UPI001AE8C2E4|nr:LEA type 2 family protein [Thermococcus stetteri]
MKKLVAVVLLIVLILILWGAYVAYAVMTLNPSFKAGWGNVSTKRVEVVIDADLGKALLVPASIDDLSMKFNGVEVASLEEFRYSPTKTEARLVIGIDPNKLVEALEKYFDNNQRGDAEVEVKLGLFGLFHPTFRFSQEFQQDVLSQLDFKAESRPVFGGLLYTPSVEGTRVVWMGAENGVWKLKTYATLENPNSFPIPVSNFEFELFINGIKIGVGKVAQGVTIPAGGVATVPIDTEIYSEYLPAVLVAHIKNGEKSSVAVNFYLTVSAGGKSARIKLTGGETIIQTDIMASINGAFSEISPRE